MEQYEESKTVMESNSNSVQSELIYRLHIKELKLSDYQEIVDDIVSGKLFINVNATGLLFKIFVKILEQINQSLIALVSEKGKFSKCSIRKFVVSYSLLTTADFSIFSSFVAPNDDLWF